MRKEDSKKTQEKVENKLMDLNNNEICVCEDKEIYGNTTDGFKCGNCGKKAILFEPTQEVDIL